MQSRGSLARVGVDYSRRIYTASQHLVHLGCTGAVKAAAGELRQHSNDLGVRVAFNRCKGGGGGSRLRIGDRENKKAQEMEAEAEQCTTASTQRDTLCGYENPYFVQACLEHPNMQQRCGYRATTSGNI